jgi:hypothetical protein
METCAYRITSLDHEELYVRYLYHRVQNPEENVSSTVRMDFFLEYTGDLCKNFIKEADGTKYSSLEHAC